ncbi:MAG: hypothetical protein NT062_02700 [Proteobacteria bacterium]|nr:hypothetical protein [Pseudomonadota bacterium]
MFVAPNYLQKSRERPCVRGQDIAGWPPQGSRDAYAGIRKKSALETLETFLNKQGWQPSDFSIELWDVYEGGRTKPRFEFWVQNAGDGMLFDHGRASSPNRIGSTQHSFESHAADDPKTLALVDALQAAAERFGAV